MESNAVQPGIPAYELQARWSDKMSANILNVPLKNEGDRPMEVIGVQATRGIFIADFPAKVAPGKEDRLSVVYVADENTDGDLEQIRVYTDQGIKEILVRVVRETAVSFDTRELKWTVGDGGETKVVTITTAANTVVPQKVRVTSGHTAVLEKAGEGQWRVKVTPASAVKSGRFAVFVDFDKPLPGTAPVILGVIQARE